jgi:uracil-DNA glycosylase
MPDVRLHPSWKKVLTEEFDKPYFVGLTEFVREEYGRSQVYPHGKNIFKALDETPFEAVKVVILGQDPYHGPGQANGLCFSVNEGVRIPPSLRNIFTEIHRDLGKSIPQSGDLSRWAGQGVLLLNATLTVRAGAAGSHQNKGWEVFTDEMIRNLSEKRDHLAFLLWGSYARRKGAVIDRSKHLVLTAPHPSPLSAHRGFIGCGHFSKANEYLRSVGKTEIDW